MAEKPCAEGSSISLGSKLSASKEEILHWHRIPKFFLLFSAAALVCSGTCDTLIAKLMNQATLKPCSTCEPRQFVGPFWQTFISYILESACLAVFFWDKRAAKRKGTTYNSEYVHLHTTAESFVKPTCPFWMWAFPSFFDFITSIGVNYSFVYLHASTAQLLRNFNIIGTAIISLLWIRIALRVHQMLGVVIVTLGLITVAIQEYITPDTSSTYDAWYLGVIFALGGTLANSVQVVIEERLFRDYHVSPCEALGYFGIFGLMFSFISFIFLELFSNEEKLSYTLYMIVTNSKDGQLLLMTTLILLCSVAIFNLSGMTVTKLGSCLLRMIVISLRTFTIWVVELIVRWNTVKPWSLSGLLITVVGVVIYNYNFLTRKESWSGDLTLRKPLLWFGFLRDPDVVEEEIQKSYEKVKFTQKQIHMEA